MIKKKPKDIYKSIKRILQHSHNENPSNSKGKSEIIAFDPLLTDATISGWFNQQTKELYPSFPVSASDHVLDVGCGTGAYSHFCGKLGANIYLADVNTDSLEIAKQHLLESNASSVTCYLTKEGEPLPAADNSMTHVLALEVMEHVDDPSNFLNDIVRVGRSGALYLISVPAPEIEQLQEPVAPKYLFKKPNHIHIFGRDAFENKVRHAGLEILRHDYNGFFWSVWWMLFWASGKEMDDNNLPDITQHWTKAWTELLRSPKGTEVKSLLDDYLPKSQIIVARKS